MIDNSEKIRIAKASLIRRGYTFQFETCSRTTDTDADGYPIRRSQQYLWFRQAGEEDLVLFNEIDDATGEVIRFKCLSVAVEQHEWDTFFKKEQ